MILASSSLLINSLWFMSCYQLPLAPPPPKLPPPPENAPPVDPPPPPPPPPPPHHPPQITPAPRRNHGPPAHRRKFPRVTNSTIAPKNMKMKQPDVPLRSN